MDPTSLIPAPEAIPVNWVWLQILLVSTTFLHLLTMNIMLGSVIIAFAGPLVSKKDDLLMSKDLVRSLPYSLALTINFGVAPLLFLQTLYGRFFYTSTLLMAVYWLSIVGLLIISYYLIYLHRYRFDNTGFQSPLLGASIAMFLLIAFFYVNNISIMQDPGSWAGYFKSRRGFLLNLADPALLPRYLHFIFSAVAVGGLSLAVFSNLNKEIDSEVKKNRIRSGCNWFTYATILNFGTGFWFLNALYNSTIFPAEPVGRVFMIMLIASVATTIPALISAQSYRLYRSVFWTAVTILLMTVAREVLRNAYLQKFINISKLQVNPEYGPFVIFLILLSAAIWLIWWMLQTVSNEMEDRS